jgi:hypothetical protein
VEWAKYESRPIILSTAVRENWQARWGRLKVDMQQDRFDFREALSALIVHNDVGLIPLLYVPLKHAAMLADIVTAEGNVVLQ